MKLKAFVLLVAIAFAQFASAGSDGGMAAFAVKNPANGQAASLFDSGVAAFNAKDYPAAAKVFASLAQTGNVQAQWALGGMYNKGMGVRQDSTEGANWLRKSAEHGYPPAQNEVGGLYFRGVGVAKDYAEAEKWWRKSAVQGDAQGQYLLGVLYSLGGYGIKFDRDEAMKWLNKAVAQRHPEAEAFLKEAQQRQPQ